MSNLELLAAGFSAILGVKVVTPDKGAGLPKLSIYDLFHHTYIMRPLDSADPGEVFDIDIKTLTGTRITVQVTNEFTIAEVKAAVEMKVGIPPRHQRLVFNSKALEQGQTIGSYGIPRGGTMFLVMVEEDGPITELQLDPEMLAPGYDYNFTDRKDDGKKYIRGGFEYQRPYGWYRYAIKVTGKPEYRGDEWLGPNGIRTASSPGEWPVSYHGTYMECAKKIVGEGFKPGSRSHFGKGVYTSPSLDVVDRRYAQKFDHKGNTYKIAFQNRVNPDETKGHLKIIPASETRAGADYWLSPKQDPEGNVYDVRPYGIIIRRLTKLDLLSEGLSAIFGVEVVMPNVGAGLPKLTIYDLIHHTFIMRPPESPNPYEVFDINIKDLVGMQITMQVTNDLTIAEVKAEVEKKWNIPLEDQRLAFNGTILEEDQTIGSYGIPRGGTIFLAIQSFQLDAGTLAPECDHDFTDCKDDGKKYIRGGFEYQRPYGWYRYAIKVTGKPEYGGDEWLGPEGTHTESFPGEWPVSYHGTYMERDKKIKEQGFKPGSGKGVYSSPSLDMVERRHAQQYKFGQTTYEIAFQNRVNPDVTNGHLRIIPASETRASAEYWVSPKHDPGKNVYDVRPYGIIIRRV